MRMKARPYLHCAPVPGGVFFSGARTQFVMRGWEPMFKVADVCVPLLEDGATEDELVAALGAESARPVVRHLTAKLRDHDMLLDNEGLTVDEPQADVRARYAGSIAYLESVCADPYAVFAGLRAAKVALFGPPEAVRPAARGLTRAGVGRVLFPASAEGTDDFGDVDAVLWCCGRDGEEDEFLAARGNGRLPQGVPIIPVVLDDQVLLAGPVIRDADGYRTWSALRRRVLDWAEGEQGGPAARPVADALIGALAGQSLFEELTGVADSATAHMVHGAELVADRVEVRTGGRADDRWRSLSEAEVASAPDANAAIKLATVLTTRWTGLFTRATAEEELPQLPLSIRELEYRTDRAGSVLAWGPDQQSATIGVALEALRRSSRGPGTGAAGLTEERWLLDGALRLLAADARRLEAAEADDLEPETFRIWQSFQKLVTVPCVISVQSVPGLDWRLGQVEVAGTGEVLGLAWCTDAPSAIREAIGTAHANAQVLRAGNREDGVAELRTDALVFLDEPEVSLLRKQITIRAVADGVFYRGRARRGDPILGEIPFWSGPVQARSLVQEPKNAY